MDTVLLCKLFIGKNATFVPIFPKCTTEQTLGILWHEFAIPFAFALLICVIYLFLLYLCYKCLINRYFDKESRKHALVTGLGAAVATFSVWATNFLAAFGLEPEMYFLPLMAPLLFFIGAHHSSRLQILPTVANCIPHFVAVLSSIVLFPVLLHIFPQRLFSECTVLTLIAMGAAYFNFVAYFMFFVFFFSRFWATLTAERLYLFENYNWNKPIGYLTKKCGFWVKVELPAPAEPE